MTLVDLDAALIDKAKKSIEKNLERVGRKQFKDDKPKVEEFVRESFNRITGSTDVQQAIKNSNADIVIEAIVENLELKQKLFNQIDGIAKQSTIFASNTSSIPISEISKNSNRKDRFCGLHFFNPVPVNFDFIFLPPVVSYFHIFKVMKLLEVIRIPETSEATYQTVMAFGKRLGKTCVTCKGENLSVRDFTTVNNNECLIAKILPAFS